MTPREAVLAMLDEHEDASLALARAIKRHEGWTCGEREARDRVRKTLRGVAGRHFCLDWALIAIRVSVWFDLDDMLTPLFYEARQEALYEQKREMRTVPARARGRDVG